MKQRADLFLFALLAVAGSSCIGEVASGPESTGPAAAAPWADPIAPAPAAATGAAPAPQAPGVPMTTPPAVSPPPAGAPAAPIIATGGRGILGCPTVQAPPYGAASLPTLSRAFQTSCATCHGGVGEGKEKYPAVPNKLTEASYIAKVRQGTGAMPSFPAEFVSDAELKADFAKLSALALIPGAVAAAGNHPSTWSAAKIDEVYRKGLETWRKPGVVDKQACANCHSADGIELAVIGFSDDAILRRAQQHVSAEDALALRDFVHAQRQRFKITQPCATEWRPFQPGGSVLPGATGDEQDAAFLAHLRKLNLMVATGKVVSLDDAKKALGELQAIKLRELPIGIPLPRWSADKFNGPQHRDINDYMPAVPTVPNRPAEYFAIEDSYLANPTDAALYKLLDENKRNMNDMGYAAANSVPSNPKSNCGAFPNSTAWIMSRVNTPKRLSVLVAAHLFREELVKPGSWFKRPAAPFPDAPFPVNPGFFLGGMAIEPPCYDNINYPSWIKAFPPSFRDEFPESDLARGVVENATDRITHNWMMLGQVMDQTLIATDNMTDNKIHYWAFRNFTQKQVHLPFVYTHRMASLTTYWTSMRNSPVFPTKTGPFNQAGRDWLHPLLATTNQESAGLQSAVAPDHKTLPGVEVNQLKGNLIRTLMLLRRDLLQKGATLQTDQNYDHCLAVTCQTGQMKGYVSSLKTHAATATGKAAFAAKGFDLALYQDDTGLLITEVLDLMAKAPKR